MFAFFRKYQRYFYLVISTVIIISFSFFGTYNALPNEEVRSQTAFYATDGTAITRAELDEMVLFLSTDSEDKVLFGGYWGPNFLNDGVIKRNFLQTGLGNIIAEEFPTSLNEDLQTRLQHEKRFELYKHPEASFVSTESVWSAAAPGLKNSYDTLLSSENPLSLPSFNARTRLYLGQKRLPPSLLRQYLRYQEKQYTWLTPDPALDQTDLSLFGYHTLEEWYGPSFIRLIAEFVINSAKEAIKQGYSVPMDEALADLNRNANLSFQQNIRNPHLGVTNSQEYLNEQLRLMGMDQRSAAKIWQNVLLFRRLFQDAGNSIFVDPQTFASFVEYAKESISGEIYQLPKELKFPDEPSRQKFELYLSLVAKANSKESLGMPNEFLSPVEMKKKHPELVQKRYLIDIASLDKSTLLSKVSLKETWDWEAQEKNWAALKKEVPELASKNSATIDERINALDNLDVKSRAKADAIAQAAILEAHPEWIIKALKASPSKTVEVSLSPKRGSSLFPGLQDAAALITLLDAAPLKEDSSTDETTKGPLALYSPDQRHFYKINVIARSETEELLTFAEANRSGVLDKLLETKAAPADSQRLSAYVRGIQELLKKDPNKEIDFVSIENEPSQPDQLSVRKPLSNQWKLEKLPFNIDRSSQDERISMVEAMDVKEWSEVANGPNGAIYFYRKIGNQSSENSVAVTEIVQTTRQHLSSEAQSTLGKRLATQWKSQNSISLDYLQVTPPVEDL